MTMLDCIKDSKYHGKIKYIEVRHNIIRDMVVKKEMLLKYILMSQMIIDPPTKPTTVDIFSGLYIGDRIL